MQLVDEPPLSSGCRQTPLSAWGPSSGWLHSPGGRCQMEIHRVIRASRAKAAGEPPWRCLSQRPVHWAILSKSMKREEQPLFPASEFPLLNRSLFRAYPALRSGSHCPQWAHRGAETVHVDPGSSPVCLTFRLQPCLAQPVLLRSSRLSGLCSPPNPWLPRIWASYNAMSVLSPELSGLIRTDMSFRTWQRPASWPHDGRVQASLNQCPWLDLTSFTFKMVRIIHTAHSMGSWDKWMGGKV